MEPEKPTNYWDNNAGSDQPTEMYAPEPVGDEPMQPKVAEQPKGSKAQSQQKGASTEEPVHWSAAEYIDNKRGGLWFVAFALVVVVLIAVDLFLFKSYTFSVLVVVMAVALVVLMVRPSRVIDYTLSGDQGLYIGEKLYHFSEFKAFGIISEDGHHSIMLIPVKRFALALSVYFPEEVGEKIVDIFGARLPMRDLKLDVIDVIVRKLRL